MFRKTMLAAGAWDGLEGKAQDQGTKEEAIAVIKVRAILSGPEDRREGVGVRHWGWVDAGVEWKGTQEDNF